MDDGGVKLEELLVVALRVTCLRLDHVRLLIFYHHSGSIMTF